MPKDFCSGFIREETSVNNWPQSLYGPFINLYAMTTCPIGGFPVPISTWWKSPEAYSKPKIVANKQITTITIKTPIIKSTSAIFPRKLHSSVM